MDAYSLRKYMTDGRHIFLEEGRGGRGLGILKVFLRFCQVQPYYLDVIEESTLRILTITVACQTCTKQYTQAYLIAPRFRCTGTKLPDKIKGIFFSLLGIVPQTWPDNFLPHPTFFFNSTVYCLSITKRWQHSKTNVYELIL